MSQNPIDKKMGICQAAVYVTIGILLMETIGISEASLAGGRRWFRPGKRSGLGNYEI